MTRILNKFRWTWKVPTRFQIHKYSAINLIRYMNYLNWISNIPHSKLKFADESHIISKDLTKKRVLGMKHTRVYIKERTLNEAHASLTILVSSTGKPITLDYRVNSNTQWNFVDFILHCCRTGALVRGDFLVIDNATVHNGWDSSDVMQDVLSVAGVTLIFLPAYSPELNPCELIFAMIKSHIRAHRKFGSLILQEVLTALAMISPDNIKEFYSKCIAPSVVLPELNGL